MVEVQILQEQISARPSMGIRRTTIHGSLRHTTTTDGGSADIAGANIRPPISGHRRIAIHGSLRHTAHPWDIKKPASASAKTGFRKQGVETRFSCIYIALAI
jgi:hypothetical protein